MALRVVLVVIAALVSLCALGTLAALAVELGNNRIVTETRALPAAMRSLTIDTGDVPVALSLTTDVHATEPRVDLRILTRTDNTQLAVANDDTGSRVTLGDSGSGLLGFNRTGEIKAILPPGVARGLRVMVNQRAGSLSTDADLDQLVVKTDNGAVTLGGSARRVDVSVRHGDISTSTRLAVTESFRAETESGGISVEFRAAPRTTEAIADGDVTVGVPGPGPYQVRAQSEGPHGQTTVTVPETTDPSAPGVTAHSKSANVMITELR
ncbi:MAG: hypothetical protein QOC90_69 [Mycobacterium sp.]|nr:hypothetical protein [Mycobacterium sp.]